MRKKIRLFVSMKTFLSKISCFSKKIADAFFSLLKKYDWVILFLTLSSLGIVIRVLLFDKTTDDFTIFLNNWYLRFYDEGFLAMGKSIGDYTPAYNYFLWFLSLFQLEPGSLSLLHAIKWISLSFDYVLAIYGGLIVYRISGKDKIKAIVAYGLLLFGLTIFLNSAAWGQCDAISASFVLMSFYYFLGSHHRTSAIMLGVAFAFKLQTIFVVPFYLVMFLRRKINLKYALWLPIIYLLFALPACFAAPNFFDRFQEICLVYFRQSADSYQQLALNCSTLYSLLFQNFQTDPYAAAFSIPLAIVIIGLFVFFLYSRKEDLDEKSLVKAFALFALLTPFVLPHMHDRYYYLADVAILIYVVLHPKKFYLAILAVFVSLIGYMAYLWKMNLFPIGSGYSFSFRIGAIVILAVICLLAFDLFQGLASHGKLQETSGSDSKENA